MANNFPAASLHPRFGSPSVTDYETNYRCSARAPLWELL